MTLVGIAAAAVGCSNPAGNLPTSPSEAPATLANHGGTGGSARYYGAQVMSGSPVAAGSTSSFSIEIENCNGAGTCDNSHATFSTQKIGHATIEVPAVFTGVVVNPNPTESDAGDAGWSAGLVVKNGKNYIQLVAPAGNKRLEPGQSVTVTFDATAPCDAGEYDWNTAAYQDVDANDDDTPYTIVPGVDGQPSITVTGNCVTECTVKGQGYWEHHFGDWPAIGSGLMLGNRLYSAAELLSILQQNPVAGNGLIALAHQLVSAKLNLANGANGSSIASTIAAADALIGNLVVPPVGAGSLAPSQTGALTQALDDFNSQCED